MKTLNVIGVLLFAIVGKVHAVVIENDVALNPSGVNKWLTLGSSIPSGTGAFIVEVQGLSAASYKFSFLSIAESNSIYLASTGLAFDSGYVFGHLPLISNYESPFSVVSSFALNEVKYFSYWDDRSLFDGIFNSNDGIADSADNYGWMAIQRTASGLIIQNSATAIGGGIIIGSTTQIPEFSAIGLALGTIALCSVLIRQTKTQEPNKAPHPTPVLVTNRAPSSTLRAKHLRG